MLHAMFGRSILLKVVEHHPNMNTPGKTFMGENGPSHYNFGQDYLLEKRLRSGSYGVVYTTRHRGTNNEFAVKVIDRTKLRLKDDEATFREVAIMKDLGHIPNIVGLIDFYVEPKTFYVVQVYAKGGDVFDRLAKRVIYTEKDARDLGMVLLRTMKHLHTKKIAHRDLKPENLLLKEQGDDCQIMVADFGFAKYVPQEGLKTRCGTPAFVAPEVVLGQHYSTQADMWSVGCLLYMLLGGYPPFQDETHQGLFRKIRAADFAFHDKYWSNASLHAKQLISKLLTVDPRLRLNAESSLLTTWLEIGGDELSRYDLSESISEIKSFSAKRKIKGTFQAALFGVSLTLRTEKLLDLLQLTDKVEVDAKSTAVGGVVADHDKAQGADTGVKRKKRFEELYDLGARIHRGSCAVVKECFHRERREKYAVKIIERDGKSDEAVLHEVAIMNHLDHPHILKVVDFYEDEEFYYIVMELMTGGDVFDRIVSMKQYSEADARDLVRILLESVSYMHESGVAHRDLKPQNLLLKVRSCG